MTKEEVKNRYENILEKLQKLEQELHQLANSLDANDVKTDNLWWSIIDTEKYVKQARTIINE